MTRRKEEYDWLNDPFDEKKAAQEAEEARVSTGKKMALGCGCLLVVLAVCILLIFGGVQMAAILAA